MSVCVCVCVCVCVRWVGGRTRLGYGDGDSDAAAGAYNAFSLAPRGQPAPAGGPAHGGYASTPHTADPPTLVCSVRSPCLSHTRAYTQHTYATYTYSPSLSYTLAHTRTHTRTRMYKQVHTC
jgi:hypothetical protein